MSETPSITAGELAACVGGALEGDSGRVVREVATFEQAGPESLSWAGTPDLLPRAIESAAGVLLIPEGCSLPPGRTVIRVADPDLALCDILDRLAPPADAVADGVHPTATVCPGATVDGAAIGAHVYIGPGATVGSGTQLHPGVYVGAHATVGLDCVLWPNVVVEARVTIGDRVIIHPNATIGADGFGYLQRDGVHRKIPQIGTVVIEDDVEIGANSTVDRARSGVTRVGRGTKLDNLVQIAHNADIGEHCLIVSQSGVAGSSTLDHHVFMSGQVGVTDHVHLGAGVQVAAKSAVMGSASAGEVLRGIPATDFRRSLREQAALRKLPEWLKKLRDFGRRVERLEARSGDGD